MNHRMTKPIKDMYDQQRLRSALEFSISEQSPCRLYEETRDALIHTEYIANMGGSRGMTGDPDTLLENHKWL